MCGPPARVPRLVTLLSSMNASIYLLVPDPKQLNFSYTARRPAQKNAPNGALSSLITVDSEHFLTSESPNLIKSLAKMASVTDTPNHHYAIHYSDNIHRARVAYR